MDPADEQPTAALLDARYRLGECIGRGGSASVYRAEDTLLGRTVAIKILENPADAAAPERVRGETAVLASLNHPHLVTLFDAQLVSGRTRYLVMEFVDGPTLSARLREGPLTREQAAMLARDLADALHVVHASGIIHRDIKPSNVLLGPPLRRDADWSAKLADFGIAHVVDDPRVTSPGTIIGTAAYMAPEQLGQGKLTPAVDIYSLGLVLLETLTGAPAYPGTRGVESALARLSAPPAIPASLGRGWTDLLHRMTKNDPEHRPTAHEVADAASALAGTGAAPLATFASPFEDDSEVTAVLADTRTEHAPTSLTRVMRADASDTATPAAPGAGRRHRRTLIGVASAAAVLAIAAITGGVWASASADGDAPRAATRIGAHNAFAPEQAVTEAPVEDPGTTPASDNSNNSNGKDDKSNNGKGDENKNDKGKGNGKKK